MGSDKKLWKKIATRSSILLSVLLSLLLFFLPVCYCMTNEMTQLQNLTQTEQYNLLQQKLKEQEKLLVQLEVNLTTQDLQSTEVQKQLAELKLQLSQAKTQIEETKVSLANALNSIEKVSLLLENLKKQIVKERAIHKRELWQNRFWSTIVGIGIGALAKR